mmetsp:Transcript_119788/g.284604  ORF Transcript_119788/g.284604 Transcript_119788/m.284604 type:complete len:488 (-) Transcript_119788:197-1660(-)
MCCRTICGQDCDDIFVYDAQKTIRIRDARLGLLQYGMMFLITVYIVVWQLIRGNSYLLYRQPTVSTRMSLQQPTLQSCSPNDPSCQDTYKKVSDLPYCCTDQCTMKEDNSSCSCPWRSYSNYVCQYVDGVGGTQIYPNDLVINTFRHEYVQERNSSCGQDGCSKLWVQTAAQHRFMADVEDFTLLVDHAVQNQDLGIARTSRDMTGWLLVNGTQDLQQQLCRSANTSMTQPIFGKQTDQAPCYIKPNNTGKEGLDYFSVSTLMMAMGLDLDRGSYQGSGHSLRYEGLTVTLKIQYFDTWPWHGVLRNEDGQPKVLYVYSLVPLKDNPYKVSDLVYSDYPNKRVRREMHGIYVAVTPEGELGVFDLQTLLVTVTTSLTLLALAATVVKYIAMYFLTQRKYYKEMLIHVSADFSDVRDLEVKTDEEIEEIMKDKGLPMVGTRVQRVLAILEAGGLSHHNHSTPAPGRLSVSETGGARLLESGESQMRLR